MRPYYDQDGVVIYHGDCREVMPTLAPVAAVVTDPPYGTGWAKGGGRQGEFRGRLVTAAWDVWSTDWIGVARPLTETFAIFCPDARVVDLGAIFPAYRLRYYLKTNPRPAMGGSDSPSIEPIFVTPRVRYSKGPSHFPAYNGDCTHPCQKPLSLMAWLIQGVAAFGGAVLDPFAGSGSTLVAARLSGRSAIGIEIEERYCEIAAKRLAQQVLPLAPPEPAPEPVGLFDGGEL